MPITLGSKQGVATNTGTIPSRARARGQMPKMKAPKLKKAVVSDMPSDRIAGKGRDPATGRFLPGHRFWETRTSSGPKPRFTEADALWRACVEYFEWVDDNPLFEDQLVTFQGKVTHVP